MKTKEILYTTMGNNIGQVRIENAQKEIDRLNEQENTNSWRMDNSEFMFVEDETDDDIHNPCELIEGYVWITCEPEVKSTSEQALNWWKNLPHEIQGKHWSEYKDNNVTSSTNPSNLPSREIEKIWRKEVYVPQFVNNLKEIFIKETINTKQFKQGNPELVNAYFSKFSKEELYKVHLPILISLLNPLDYKKFIMSQQITG